VPIECPTKAAASTFRVSRTAARSRRARRC
jgi:hypothetical protein